MTESRSYNNFASSRKNSMTSLSTLQTNISATPSNLGKSSLARNLSTDNMMALDDKFMKKTPKRTPAQFQQQGPIGSGSVPNKPPSPDNFHKTNGGTYYFPNGEVFRPRMTPLKRNKPSKISQSNASNPQSYSRASSLTSNSHHAQYDNNMQMPPGSSDPSFQTSESPPSFLSMSNSNSNSLESVATRNNSFHNLSSLKQHYPTPLQKSHSYSNIKSASKQNLAKSIRANKLDVATNLTVNTNDQPYQRSSSMLSTNSTNSQFNVNTRNNSLVSFQNNNNSFNSYRGSNVNYSPNPVGQMQNQFPKQNQNNIQSFSPYHHHHQQPQKLQSNNILRASDANASLSSFANSSSSSVENSPLTKTSSTEKNLDPVLTQAVITRSKRSTDTSNSSSSSSYSSSSTASVSASTTDPSSEVSNSNLSRSMSNTPSTSINTDDAKNAVLNNLNNTHIHTSSNLSSSEKVDHLKDVRDAKKSESFAGVEMQSDAINDENADTDQVSKAVAAANAAVPAPKQASEKSSKEPCETEEEGNLSTLNEVSEENLSKTLDEKSFQSMPTSTSFKNAGTKGGRANSDDDLSYLTASSPQNDKGGSKVWSLIETPEDLGADVLNETSPSIRDQCFESPRAQTHHNYGSISDGSIYDSESYKKHERSVSALPEPTIEDSCYDFSEEDKFHSAANTPDIDNSFRDQSSPKQATTSPKTTFFDFNSNNKFNKFLNDDQAQVPPRGDLVVLDNQKIRKHERASSSISSFNSILGGDFDSPRTPNRSMTASPPLALGSPGEVAPSSKLKINLDQNTKQQTTPVRSVSTDPVPTVTPTAFAHPSSFNDSLKPPAKLSTQHDVSSADSSLHMYSINQGSKGSVASTAKQENATTKPLKSMLSAAPVSGSRSTGSISEPKLKSPHRAQNMKAKSMTNLNRSKPSIPPKSSSQTGKKSNFKSFLKKMFSSGKSPKVNYNYYTSNHGSYTDNETDTEQSKHTNAQQSECKSIQSTSRQSVAGSTSNSVDARSINSLQTSSIHKRSFSFRNLKSASKIGSKLTNRRTLTRNGDEHYAYDQRAPLPIPSRPISYRPDSMFGGESVLPQLPNIERDDSMFDEMMMTFDEKLDETDMEVEKQKALVASQMYARAKDPFLKDDELTSAQIKDQQMKDQQGDDVNEEEKQPLRPGSEEVYIDDNIRFLQNEFNWSSIEESELNSKLDSNSEYDKNTVELKRLSLVPPQGEDGGPIVVTKDQINFIFNNLSEFQRRNLPGHLKYIKQFQDYQFLEVSHKKFEDLEGVGIPVESSKGSSAIVALRKGEGGSKKKVIFSNKISVNETFAPDMYNRYNKGVTQYTLTESYEINNIKNELNNYKCNEMLVHEDAQHNTHFFY